MAMRNVYSKLSLLLGILLFTAGTAQAQFRLPKLPKLPGVGLDKVLKEDPPITTSLDDALTAVPALDGFTLREFKPLASLERGPNGGFLLQPGAYTFEAASYCLHAGTYGPGGGDGYLDAPLKGPQAESVRAILQNSVSHPEIPQHDVQVLLWAIIARTNLTDMPREMQRTASVLLTPKQIFKVNGGALGLLPVDLKGKAMEALPAPVRRVMEAEAQLRERLTQPTLNFAELERIAVLTGNPPAEERGPEIPGGRWSYSPDGYYVRYLPSGYSQTHVEVYMPEKFIIQRDALRRITLLADTQGNRIETEYDDAVTPLALPGQTSLRGYAFRVIRFVRPHPDRPGEQQQFELRNNGWTFVGPLTGNQAGAQRLPMGTPRLAAGFAPIGMLENVFLAPGDRFAGWKERYDDAEEKYEKYKDMRERWDRQNRDRSEQDVDDLTNLEHYEDGLETATKGDLSEKADWIAKHLEIVKNAWEYCACRLAGGCEDDKTTKDPKKRPEFDPSGHVATPADRGRQRLAQSARAANGN